jgi:arabinogalactan endo-1,4-beta-galactosidase
MVMKSADNVTNTTNHRIMVFCINLDSATDRLQLFAERMDRLGVPYERWRATSGSDLLDQRVDPYEGIELIDFREWSLNEAACGVSHIRLLKHLVDAQIPWTVILEDDAILDTALPMDVLAWNLPVDAQIVLLNDRAIAGPVSQPGAPFSYAGVFGGAGTDGYLISQEGAKTLLRILSPLKEPIDFQMYSHFESIASSDGPPYFWRLPRNPTEKDTFLRAYRLVPAAVRHAEGVSTIGNQRHPRARYWCKLLLGLEFGYEGYGSQDYYPKPLWIRPSVTETWRGVDISHLDDTVSFRSAPNCDPSEIMGILRTNGINLVRITVWVSDESAMNIGRALWLARRAAEAKLDIYLALHYSDHWADPGCQTKPKDWVGLSVEDLGGRVYSYTKKIVEAMNRQGTPPAIVQTGNEVTNGMLWASDPDQVKSGAQLYGRYSDGLPFSSDDQWATFAQLLACARAGVIDACRRSEKCPLVMVHIDRGASPRTAEWWIARALAAGVDFDIIGLSFYPAFHDGASFETLADLTRLSKSFPEKSLMIAETAFPYRPSPGVVDGPEVIGVPLTPAGQRQYVVRTLEATRRIPTNIGICWWGALFLTDSVDRCPDCFRAHALFHPDGTPLPALHAFAGK